jgi:hypothetical protein
MRGWHLLLVISGCVLELPRTLTAVSAAQVDRAEAIRQVEAVTCGGSTVGARLQEEISAHSRRDLGWQVFSSDETTDIERALRVSKSMDLRYRWRLSASGSVEAQSEAAKKLCE